mgnify:FL=1
MRLAGKRGMVISTSASNGNKFVNEYVWRTMNYMEINVVKCSEWTYNKIVNEKDYEEEIKECAKTILQSLSDKSLLASNVHESIFKITKEAILKQPEHAGEYLYWKNSGYLDCDRFQDVLDRLVMSKN